MTTSCSSSAGPGCSVASAARTRGYWLARPPGEIALADVIRVTEGAEPDARPFPRAAAPLAAIWDRLRSHENALLSEITLADVVAAGDDHDAPAEPG
ncbi:Rrf2 family transcriptional regulator [Nonomuraea salmonea]|uniref:Rrf2 family transcriptional regulator n=1 Tax=Nonomuraea salmonea TaxID=46181 RepID=UPI002FE7D082